MISFYVGIVFRRPIQNAFVLTLACLSSGDWRKANVAGYPGFKRGITTQNELSLYWAWLVAAQLCAAYVAAYARVEVGEKILGTESLQIGWGLGQLHTNSTVLHPTENERRLWWFCEDLFSVLFLIVSYIHIWKWLRWDDEIQGNPADQWEQRYWWKLVSFSGMTSVLVLANSMAFPTAHAGWHISLYVYAKNQFETNTNQDTGEPLLRALGGMLGCLLAVVYEWRLARIYSGKREWLDVLIYKMLYTDLKFINNAQ